MTEWLVSIVGWGLIFSVMCGMKWLWSSRLQAEVSFAGTLRERFPLQRSKIVKKTIASGIGVLMESGFFIWFALAFKSIKPSTELASVDGIRAWAVPVVVGWCLAALCTRHIHWILYVRRYFYDATDLTITIRKGVITQREITLPFSQITDVNVDQDMFDVVFGLYDVHISTATQASGLQAHIDGLCKTDAMQLKELILNGITRGKTANMASNGTLANSRQ
jgi:membrane protein YdbS with pleckstrin-like domain